MVVVVSCAVLIAYGLSWIVLLSFGGYWFVSVARAARRPVQPPAAALEETGAPWPFVTVQVAVCGEGALAARAVAQLALLDYPRDRFEIQICDDSSDAETIAICRAAAARWSGDGLQVVRVERPDRKGFKAGNLNAALQTAKGELIAVVDADYVVDPSMLKKTVPFFLDDPRVAAVQTYFSHENAGTNLLTRSLQEGFDIHQSGEQTSRSDADLWPAFMGSAGVWRRTAIVECGGWPLGTGTEDVYLSTLVQIAGWRVKYTAACTSYGLLPETPAVCRAQWRRWAKSNGIVLRRLFGRIVRSRAPIEARIAGVAYLLAFAQHAAMATLMFVTFPAMLIVAACPDLAWLEWATVACFCGWFSALVLLTTQAHRRRGRSWSSLLMTAGLLTFHQSALSIATGPPFVSGLLGGRFDRWVPSHGALRRPFAIEPWLEAVAVASVGAALYTAVSTNLWVMALPTMLWAFWTAALLLGPLWLPVSGRLLRLFPAARPT